MTPWLQDPDLTLYVGDVRDVLAGLPDESVDCVVTSPPYWGLRDYGTGEWDGGDPDCDHIDPAGGRKDAATLGDYDRKVGHAVGAVDARVERREAGKGVVQYREACRKCGARRVDRQLGLEPTPDEYVASMVAVFREVRRVLRRDGTCWLNLGDSYNNRAKVRETSHQPALNNFTDDTWADRADRGGVRMSMNGDGMKEKDLCMIPARVALALQADGWYLRADIIWAKPNPMPESVTDRPTKSHEYVFLLSRSPRYWFDSEAVREKWADDRNGASGATRSKYENMGARGRGDGWVTNPPTVNGRNVRSVWEIATQPYPEAHFATFPEELARRCIVAGCPEWRCGTCGKARERLTDVTYEEAGKNNNSLKTKGGGDAEAAMSARPYETRMLKHTQTVGWSDCGHDNYQPGVVLDPFLGSGTTALVARNQGRRCVGIELNPEYARLAARRLQQLSLLAEVSR